VNGILLPFDARAILCPIAGMIAMLAFDPMSGGRATWSRRLEYLAIGLIPGAAWGTSLGLLATSNHITDPSSFSRDLARSLEPFVVAAILYVGLRFLSRALDAKRPFLPQPHGALIAGGAAAVSAVYLLFAIVLLWVAVFG
jgi:hypothetical protein